MVGEEEDDRRVTRRSNDECRRIANNTKSYYGIERVRPVNIGRILRSGKVLTLRGEKTLVYKLVDDKVLGTKDAHTQLVDDNTIRITAKKTIDFLASCGDNRSRMTLAHELGHAVMHAEPGAIDHRAACAAGTTTISKTDASESAEHQAKVFASAFLIHDKDAAELESPMEIAIEFGVSLSAAEICFERIQAEKERRAAVARVLESNKSFQAQMRVAEKPPKKYLQTRCPGCSQRTLVPVGIKVVCDSDNRGYVGDDPESGDPSGNA